MQCIIYNHIRRRRKWSKESYVVEHSEKWPSSSFISFSFPFSDVLFFPLSSSFLFLSSKILPLLISLSTHLYSWSNKHFHFLSLFIAPIILFQWFFAALIFCSDLFHSQLFSPLQRFLFDLPTNLSPTFFTRFFPLILFPLYFSLFFSPQKTLTHSFLSHNYDHRGCLLKDESVKVERMESRKE